MELKVAELVHVKSLPLLGRLVMDRTVSRLTLDERTSSNLHLAASSGLPLSASYAGNVHSRVPALLLLLPQPSLLLPPFSDPTETPPLSPVTPCPPFLTLPFFLALLLQWACSSVPAHGLRLPSLEQRPYRYACPTLYPPCPNPESRNE